MLSLLLINQSINQSRDGTKLLEVVHMAMTLSCWWFPWVYTYLQVHQIVYLNYVHLFVRQL